MVIEVNSQLCKHEKCSSVLFMRLNLNNNISHLYLVVIDTKCLQFFAIFLFCFSIEIDYQRNKRFFIDPFFIIIRHN